VPDTTVGDVDVTALKQRPALGVLTVADPEVQHSAKDDSELFGLGVLVDERTDSTTIYTPEAELHLLTVDYPTSESRPVGLLEGIVI